MGNRAVITTTRALEGNGDVQSSPEVGIYLHWNGGRDSVSAFLKYCELKGYRDPDTDGYGMARLCQVISNFFGGSTSVGIGPCYRLDCDNWDNGVYIIKDWKIVGRKYFDGSEQGSYDMVDMLRDINGAQPKEEQLELDVLENAAQEFENSVKICSHCGADMSEGYCIGDGESYYCSDECLEANIEKQEYEKMYKEGDAYWTEWR